MHSGSNLEPMRCCDVEKDRVGIIYDGGCGYYMQGSNIFDDDRYKLEDIDGDDFTVLVVLPAEQGTRLHFLRKFNVSPEF